MTAAKGNSADSAKSKKQQNPRRVQEHEIKELLIQRCGMPRLNVRDYSTRFDGTFLHPQTTMSADEIGWLYLSLSCPKLQWPKGQTIDAVQQLASDHKFDPVEEYLKNIENVQPMPLDQWHNLDKYLLGTNNPVGADFLPQYFIGAVARVFSPGLEARCSPVLIGAQQRGKTTLGKILFGAEHWVEGLSDLSKDSRMRCQTAWGVELSELDGVTRRSEVESLKTFLSEVEDSFRVPYGRGIGKFPRRFVFWGTSNSPPMRDVSGNTRFLCIPIEDKMLPLDWAIANRDALWARAIEQYRSGVSWTVVTEKQRKARHEQNLNHQVPDVWIQSITELLKQTNGFCTLNDIVKKLDLPATSQNSAAASRIGGIMNHLGWTYARRRLNSERMRGYWSKEALKNANERHQPEDDEDGIPF
jgi:predicted P-loop ATPase